MHYVFVSQVAAHDVIAHDCKLKRGAGLGTLYKIDTTHFLISLVTVHFGEMYAHLENGRKTLGWGAPEESILVKFHRDRKHEFSPQNAWLSRGNPLISGKPRLVKYYNLARINPIYTPSIVGFYSVYPSLKGSNGPNRGWNSGGLGPPDLKVYTIILPKNTPSWRFTSRKKTCPKITAFQIISRDNHQTFQVPKMKVLTYKSCM